MTRPAWTNVPLEAGDALIVRQIEIHRTDTHDVDKRQWRLALGFKILRKDRSFVRNVVGSSPFGYDYSVMRDRWPALLPSLSIGHSLDELAFYDRKTLKCMGVVDAHMTVNYGWSADSKYFLTAILFPRLRVDNGYRIWSCAGGLLHSEKLEELTIASWRPQSSSLYPMPTDADIRAHPAASASTAPTSKATKYVPPGQRAAGGGGRSLSAVSYTHLTLPTTPYV